MYLGRDELIVIQEDIQRAMKKPEKRWGMVIDQRRCTACHACTASCVAEHKSPPGIVYRPVYEEEMGIFPKVKLRFTPRLCNQCDNPPCVAACPNKGVEGATWKATDRLTTGVVMINYDQCIGCGRCVLACPYKSRALDSGRLHTEGTPRIEGYEKAPAWEYGRAWPREKNKAPVGKARKCHFCVHRLRAGMVPACVSTCPSRANAFGDLNDPDSLTSIWLKEAAGKTKVLSAVRSKTEENVKSDLKQVSPAEFSAKIGYPGKKPVFADTAPTRPRVFYILP